MRTEIFELDADGKSRRAAVALGLPVNLAVAPGASGTASARRRSSSPEALEHRTRPTVTSRVTTIEQDGKVVDALRNPLRHPHDPVHRGQRLPAQRRARAAQRRLQPSRPGRARRGLQHPRAGAAARDSQGDGLQRHPHQPQPARAGAARPLRPHGLRRDGRGVRLLGARQEARTITTCSSRTGTRRTCAPWSAATAIIPASSSGASATKSASRARPRATRSPRELAGIVHEEDPTRPVTAGCNNVSAGYNGFQKHVDVFGYNYKPGEYGKFRQANPDPAAVRQRDRFVRQFARRILLPGQQRQGPGPGGFPGELLRPLRAALGHAAGHGVSRARTSFPSSPASLSGPASITSASRRPTTPTCSNLLNFTDPGREGAAGSSS